MSEEQINYGERQQDKNRTILKVNDRLKDKKGLEWKIENIGGVTLVTRSNAKGQMVETKPFRKFDFTTSEKM